MDTHGLLVLMVLFHCSWALEDKISMKIKVKNKAFNCLFNIQYEDDRCFRNSTVSCSPNERKRRIAKNVKLELNDGTEIMIKKLKISWKKDTIVKCKAKSAQGGRCKDTSEKCIEWKSYCNDAKWKAWMKKNCPKTCNICQGSACSCNGKLNDNGQGECKTKYQGHPFCYVNEGDCQDQQESFSLPGWFWSYQACQSENPRCFDDNTAYSYGEYIVSGRDNFQATAYDCQKSCYLRDGCNFWTWGKQRTQVYGRCYLKTRKTIPGIELYHPDYISGPKICAETEKYSENVENLSSKQNGILLEAMRRLQDSPGWTRVASLHGEPVRPECSNQFCCVHNEMGSFLPWHRIYMNMMDEEIQKIDPTIVMPYWDWTTSELPTIAKAPNIYNSITGIIMKNPFYRGFIEYQQNYTSRALNTITEIDTQKHFEDVLTALEEEDFILFSLQLHFVHNDIHDYVGGDMFTLERSSYDPVFYLHHSFVDLIWAVYQIINQKSLPSNEVLEQVQIPWVETAEDTVDLVNRYNLDLKSDRIVFGGLTLKQIKKEIILRRKKDKVYAGFFLRSFSTSGRIHFTICVLDDCSLPGGDVVVFGGEREKHFVNSYPFKVDITEDLENAGITNIETVSFNVTSFETIDGGRPPFQVFQPVKIWREGATGKYNYCFFLKSGNPQPPKIKIPKKCGVRIESQHAKVYATDAKSNYEKCKTKGKHVTSMKSGQELDLKPGIHYFYDDDCEKTSGPDERMGKLTIEVP